MGKFIFQLYDGETSHSVEQCSVERLDDLVVRLVAEELAYVSQDEFVIEPFPHPEPRQSRREMPRGPQQSVCNRPGEAWARAAKSSRTHGTGRVAYRDTGDGEHFVRGALPQGKHPASACSQPIFQTERMTTQR